MREHWLDLMKMMVLAGGVKFRRNFKPRDAKGKPWLCVFWDGSNSAFAVCIYARWYTEQGVQVRLVTAKSKVAPMIGTSTPRMELEAATLGDHEVGRTTRHRRL